MPKPKLRRDLDTLTSGIVSTGLELVQHRGKKKQLRGGILSTLAAIAIPMLIEYGMSQYAEDKQRKADAEQSRADYEAEQKEIARRNKELEDERNIRFAETKKRNAAQSLLGQELELRRQSAESQRAIDSRRAQSERAAEQFFVEGQNASIRNRQQLDRLRARSENQMYGMEDTIAQTRARNQAALRRRQTDDFARDSREQQFETVRGRIQDQEETYANLFDVERRQAIQTRQAEEMARNVQFRRPTRVIQAISTVQQRR